MELQGDTGHVKSSFGLFGDGVSVGDRQVHGFFAIGLETILDASIVLLGDEAQVQGCFGLF